MTNYFKLNLVLLSKQNQKEIQAGQCFLHIFDISKQFLLLHFTFGGSLHNILIFKNPGFIYVNL